MRRHTVLRVGLAAIVGLPLLVFIYRAIAFRGAGTDLVVLCREGPADAMLFEIEGTLSNEFYYPSNPAPWCGPGQMGGRSTGDGSGTIGDFEFVSDWCIDEGVLTSKGESLTTVDGQIFMNEETLVVGNPARLEAMLRTNLGPPLDFEGVFTITGGTGAYEGATGEANLVGEQLGGGRTAFAACGVISYD